MAFQINNYNGPSSEIRGRIMGQNLPGWLQGFMFNQPFSHRYGNQFRINNGGNYITFTQMPPSNFVNHGRSMQRTEYRSYSSTYGDYIQSSTIYESGRNDVMRPMNMERPNYPFVFNDCSCYSFGNMRNNDSSYQQRSFEYGETVDMSRFINIRAGRPIRDHNGDYYNLGASFVTGNKYYFLKCEGDEYSQNAKIVATIPSRFSNHIGYFHTFGLTDNYLVFCEQPWAFDVEKMRACSSQDRYFRDCIDVMSGEKNYFYLLDKRTGKSLEFTYSTDKPYYFFNFINCYEHNNEVVIDVLSYDGPNVNDYCRMNMYRSRYGCSGGSSEAQILRFALPTSNFQGEMEVSSTTVQRSSNFVQGNVLLIQPQFPIRDRGFEYPIINPRFNFKKYQFTYFVDRMSSSSSSSSSSCESSLCNSVTKINLDSGETWSWKTENDYTYPSEVVFVPNPNGSSEDDGVLFCCINNHRNEMGSYLAFIDPKNMQEMSRVFFDQPMGPFGGARTPYRQCFM